MRNRDDYEPMRYQKLWEEAGKHKKKDRTEFFNRKRRKLCYLESYNEHGAVWRIIQNRIKPRVNISSTSILDDKGVL